MKKCSKCKKIKTEAYFSKRKKGEVQLHSQCKECTTLYYKKYYNTNKSYILETNKNYRIENESQIKQNLQLNKEYIKKIKNTYYQRNKNKDIKMKRKRRREYVSNRCKSDLGFKLSRNLRRRLNNALRNNQKMGSAIKDLGCSISDLKFWLEFWFDEGMNWSNYGNKEGQWSIDHIKPISKFDLTNRDQLLEVCNYKNLQPMWHLGENGNVAKGNK
jgi:hypothetical protein